MNLAARELALIAHVKSRAPILDVARQMRAANGQSPHPGLYPVLILGAGDKL